MRFKATILMLHLLATTAVAQQATTVGDQPVKDRDERVATALSAANANLRQQVLHAPLGETLHVSDFLARQDDLSDLDRALQNAQPVGGTRWVDEQVCQVRLELPASKISDVLLKIAADPARQPALSPAQVRSCVSHWKRSKFCAGGSSETTPAGATTLPTTVLPLTPPDWVDEQLQAQGSARGVGSPLKLARAAEIKAAGDLRRQILSLHVDDRTTLGDAAKGDAQLDKAIDRSLLQAKTYHVDYLPDGSVNVRVSLDLQDAWDQLRK
jgi:hypothetical protein